MSDHPVLMHTAVDALDVHGLAEFYRELLGLAYRPGDEAPAEGERDADWLVLVDAEGQRVLAINGVDGLTTLKAFVVLNIGSTGSEETTLQLQDYVKGRLLPHKYPRIVTYMSELPKTGSGKIDRQSLLKSQ